MTSISECFSESYAEARPKFCSAAAAGRRRDPLVVQSQRARARTASCSISTRRASAPADAANMLVLISSTHGVEGHCGSGAQIAWLATGGPAKLPKDTGALLVHAINPYGFAWTRRVNEDNVDLNRNFVDHDKAYPKNDGYLAHRRRRPAQGVERGEQGRDRARVRLLRPEARRLRPARRDQRRPVHPSRRHLLRRRQADLEQPHDPRHRPRGARPRAAGRHHRLPYRARPVRPWRADLRRAAHRQVVPARARPGTATR